MVAREHPETVLPLVINNVVHMTDIAFRECVGNVPMTASIGGGVDVNFVVLWVVEIFSPEYVVAWSGSQMQGTCAAKQLMGSTKFCFSWRESHDGAWYRTDQVP